VEQILNNILAITDNKPIKILIVVLLALLVQKITNTLIKNAFKFTIESNLYPKRKRDQEKRAKTLISIFSAATTLLIWFIATLLSLGIFEVNVTAFVASAGFIGAAIAFSTQNIIKDFVSGMFIIAENQYRIDDYVQFDKVEGKVENISVRTTVVRDDDGKLHHVPNGSIVVSTNLSMGNLKAREQLEIPSKTSMEEFEAKLRDISQIVENDPELHKIIKAGPELAKIDKITKNSTLVTIEFTTSAAKRQAAANAIWKLVEQQKIPLF
jgi:small conductance mechanosensitive channel